MVKYFKLLIFVSLIGCTSKTSNKLNHSRNVEEKSLENVIENDQEIEGPNSGKCLSYILDTLGYQFLTNTEMVILDSIDFEAIELTNEVKDWLSYHKLVSFFEIKNTKINAFVGENVNATGFYINFYDWLIVRERQKSFRFISLNRGKFSILKKNNDIYFKQLEFSEQFIETKDFNKISYKVSIINLENNKLNFQGICDKRVMSKKNRANN